MPIKQNIRNASIKQKIIYITVFVSTIAVISSLAIFLVFDFYNFKEKTLEDAEQIAKVIGNNSVVSVGLNLKAPTKTDLYRVLITEKQVEYGAFFDRNDKVFVDYDQSLVSDS
ncbi:MAG: hypothetical protein ACI81T_001849, partial [Bacteroidia bacterium]